MPPATHRLVRPDGTLAYDDTGGTGPLVVAVPGMGDLRSEYRMLAPTLSDAGFRVVTLDLRGHGESDTTFSTFERPAIGDDVVALLRHLDAGPAHVVGTSLGASAAVWAAATAPDAVASMTLIGPFVRDVPVSRVQTALLRLLLARPWGARAWGWWFSKLFPGGYPADHDEHVRALVANLREPGRLAALQAMARTTCEDIDPRLDEVTAPSLVVMGAADPDFDDPAAEARVVADRLGGEVVVVDGAGHYPHVERPDIANPAIVAFLTRVGQTA